MGSYAKKVAKQAQALAHDHRRRAMIQEKLLDQVRMTCVPPINMHGLDPIFKDVLHR